MESPRSLDEANRCIRDIIALTTLPAIWLGAKPLRIAESLLAAIDTTVAPRMSYIRLSGDIPEARVELAHLAGQPLDMEQVTEWGRRIAAWGASHDPDEPLLLRHPNGGASIRAWVYPLGFNAEYGILAAGFLEQDAVSISQRMLLNIAASQAVVTCTNTRLQQQQGEFYRQAQIEIAARQRADEALREARSRLETALTAGELGTFVWDIVDDRLYGDRNFTVLFGIPLDADGAAPLSQFVNAIHPGDRDRVMALVQKSLTTGCDYEAEYRIMAGERERWVIARGKVERDSSGRAVRFPGVLLDITERKHAEEARREIAQRFERHTRLFEGVASTTPDFIYVFDLHGRVLYANRRLLEVWGRTLDSVIGKTCCELGYEQWHHDMHMREIAQVIETKRPVRGEVPFTAPLTGIFGVYEYIFSPVLGPDGEVEVIAGTTRDITDRKRAEEEREKLLERERAARAEADAANRAKDQFLAVLSHELRTPLAPVLTTAGALLADPDLPQALREPLQTIQRNVELEARLIDDLLDLTRIAKGKMQLNFDVLDAHALVSQTLEICRSDLYRKELQVRLDLQAKQSHVRADPVRLQQVLWNLLKNAIKFTNAGGQITIASRNEDDQLRIDVTDTGIGIDAPHLERIFNAFEQAEHATANRYGGLGLGLAISRALINAQHGRIMATSDGIARGATFSFWLSVVPKPLPGRDDGAAPPKPTPKSLDLLLVEDHCDTAAVMARLLRGFGHHVHTAGTIAAATQLAKERPFDLVISDLGLPDGSGLELMRSLRARYGLCGVAISGYGMEEDLARSREAGFIAHLTKPVNLQQIQTILRQFAERQNATAADHAVR